MLKDQCNESKSTSEGRKKSFDNEEKNCVPVNSSQILWERKWMSKTWCLLVWIYICIKSTFYTARHFFNTTFIWFFVMDASGCFGMCMSELWVLSLQSIFSALYSLIFGIWYFVRSLSWHYPFSLFLRSVLCTHSFVFGSNTSI